MADERFEFLVNNIASVCDITDRQTLTRSIDTSKDVKEFLNDPNQYALKASIMKDGDVVFTIDLGQLQQSKQEAMMEILFVKRSTTPIDPRNIAQCLDVLTFHGSPVDGLYNALRGVWCPTLLKNSQWEKIVPARVKQLLTELESTLSSSVRSGNGRMGSEEQLRNVSSIATAADEIAFWSQIRNEKGSVGQLARHADTSLKDVQAGFNDLDSLDFEAVSDLIGNTLDALNNAWLGPSSQDRERGDSKQYPQNRMEHFFNCIGSDLCRYIQKQFSGLDIWFGTAGEVAMKLKAAIRICDQWCDVPKKLTTTFWPGCDHRWEGTAHEDTFVKAFKGRLEHVLHIRTLSDELANMLTKDELASFRMGRLFEPLADSKPLLYNPYTEPQWQRAVKEYEHAISPVEAAVAKHFRDNASPILDHPQLLLQEFQKYRNLMERPSIRRELSSEREALLTLLKEFLKKLEITVERVEAGQEDDFDEEEERFRSGNSLSGGSGQLRARLMSPRLAGIVLLRQVGSKVASMLSASQGMLNDLDAYPRFAQQCEALVGRIKSEEDARFEGWLSEIQQKIDDDDSSLKLQGSLMGWRDGVLVVNFSEDLVRFLREVRQLDELGFEIPRGGRKKVGIAEKALDAEKYYRYGILLKKTANFYNSISEQMIDVQEQLLLDSLSAFASVVSKQSLTRSEGDVSWSNPAECENYIRMLQEAADKLSSENRWLRMTHESLCSQSVALMNIDLLRQTDTWKAKWRTIKEKLGTVRSRYSEKDSRLWILHWDHQIYKALEATYQMGLESLNENLSEIKVELVFANRRMEFKPPLEQIRQSYYAEMKKFVAMPNSFEGFGNNAAVYKRMGPKNSKRIVQVFLKAENLMEKLMRLLKRYAGWVRLGQIDLDQFIETRVSASDDYVINFKALKAKRKEIEKLPDQEKIDCCTVSLIPFKGFLEDLMQRVGDTLLLTLRRSLLSEFKDVDQYLEQANERLSTRPHTIAEIGAAKRQWKEIDEKKDSMKSISRACVEKKKLLLQYAPGTAVDTTEVSSRMGNLDGEGGRWDDFDIALEAFNDMIEEQKEALKGTLEEDVTQLNMNIDKFGNRWKQLKPTEVKSWEYADVLKVFDSLADWKKQFAELQEQADALTENCIAFGLTKPRFDGLETLMEDLTKTNMSWDMLKEYYDELKVMSDQDWLTFSVNVYALQDFALKWVETLKTRFVKGSYDSVAEHIASTVEKIKKSVPALKYCQGEPFKEDHWTELLQGRLQMAREVRRDNVKVEHFLARLDILMEPATLSFVKNLQARALGEVQIREALLELQGWKRSAEIKLLTQEESNRRVPLIKDWKDLFLELGDKQSLLASLKESQFYKNFADQGDALEVKISVLDFVLHTLNSIQRKWVYLEPIFSRGALPSEEGRFKRIDERFTDIMTGVSRDPKLFNLADDDRLSDDLRAMLDQLEVCQKALTDFLEAKRSAMPRFYFIGDDDLLEILGQAKDPNVIQSHLKKLFQGIHKVKFNKDCTTIVAMVSSAGEVVEFCKPVPVNEKVEEWLELLAIEMRDTLAAMLSDCLTKKNLDWGFSSQVQCLAQAIKFTDDCEHAIRDGRGALDNLFKDLNETLRDLTSHDLSGEPLMQLKMKALVFDMVHQIDMVEQLRSHRTTSLVDWQWKKQLRYYMTGGRATVKMHDAVFDYTYEYQGNAPKLVHTPLTDKCYLTLTQGMHMGFGGNPYGPAGTGKTESVKALASCMGRQVLVFNCDEALESTSMVRIFIGIVKCGAWGCFDEFNRLKEDQLSAISQQIQIIQDAIKQRTSPIQLLGRSINVNFNSGIFVTLNPAGKGYGGRSRLPDNLKALFRPVAMGAPDNELIAEVSLVTEGFTQAKDLASKIVSLFRLSKQLLSAQQHYDWGLRALKAVLNSGGKLIQYYKTQGGRKGVDAELEYEILIKAVRVNTLSKLTFADTSKFLSLIGDVFPGVQSSDITGGELEEAIKLVIQEKPFFLVEDAAQIKKMIQLKESLDQRMGCVIVGPSGCGKSSLWRVLKAALIKCGQPVVTYVMNPKSMHRERLLGHMDIDTREWADGVLTDAARKVVKEPSEVSCWIICDGDVDPEWIESLNSVLDDNHLLTLPNGERIAFGPNVNFLFETHDLRFASPATVSRMGMIFLSDEDLDVTRLIQRWLSTFPQERRMAMSSWIDDLFYKALDFVLRCDAVVESTLVGTVMNGLSQIKSATTRQEFVCGLIRGLGGNLSLSQRASLAKEVFGWSSERPPDLGAPLDCYASGGSLVPFTPAGQTRSETGYIGLKDIGDSAVIPTISVQRTMATLDSWITNMEPFILVGPEGCGKSMIVNHAFRQRRNIGIATLHCNAQTTANDVINKIAQTCSLFSAADGRVYRPRDCERLVLYLKDINLPRPDMYDTCELIAFLQQLITFDGFYNEELEFLKLERIQIVASINAATTVGRHPLSTRFTAIVRICVVDYAETAELVSVYDAFLGATLSSVQLGDRRWLTPTDRERLANMIVEVYQKTREKFTVDDRRHYLFTPRDMTQWVKNLCRYDLATENLLDCAANEANRIFRDRLVGADACNRFDQQLSSVLRSSFRHNVPAGDFHYTSLTSARGGGTKKSEGKEDGAASSVAEVMGGRLSRMTEEDFQKLVTQGIMYYEREERDLNMLLFSETLEHIVHIDRILSSFSGHLLLVGRSGVGRRNAVTIASYMLGYEFFTPSVPREYGPKQFLADVKGVLLTAGIKGEHVVLFVEDFHITNEAILEVINSLLSAGEVPGMYTHEELEPMLSPLREKMREEGTSFRTPYEFFVSRVKRYLHVVLCMDPGHPKFLYRCESNPALYAQCAVQWIGEWRSSTLKQIPSLMDGIKELIGVKDKKEGGDEEEEEEEKNESKTRNESKASRSESKASRNEGKNNRGDRPRAAAGETAEASGEALVDMVLAIHGSCEKLGATPRDYMAFLRVWHGLHQQKKQELLRDLGHLEAGLSKLESAAEVVSDLRTNAVQQQKDLNVAQTAADRAMEEISKALAGASDRRNEVAEVKRTVADNEAKTQARKAEIEAELSEIQPVLDAAKQAVGMIKNEHLNEIRSLNAPPEAIADVLAAVLMILGVQDLSWLSMKKFLSNRGVKEDILHYDAKRMSDEIRKNVAKLIKKKSASFEAANIQRVSIAAAPMAAWVKANIKYSLVIEKIEPLDRELQEEVNKLEQSQKRLARCEDELSEIDDRVAKLKGEFANRTAEAERLKRNLSIAGETLDKAEGLIGQLSGEQERWKTQAGQLRGDLAKLPMKMLLAAGFATYLAKTPEDVRAELIGAWQGITGVSNFSFKRVMSTESELLLWKSMGLPSDDLSQENSLVIAGATSDRVPFVIDPASACTDWLRRLLSNDKNRPLEVVTHHDPRFSNQVELAVRFGKTLLILEVDGVEPMLYPLCRKDLAHQGPRFVVTVGDKTVDYNENFCMYLVTRNPTPDIPPDAASLVTQVNFTVTRSGLEGQLLGLAIQHEQPELEREKGEMLKREEDFKMQLSALEKDLLQALATAEGNLLENKSLIDSLSRTKEKSKEIEEALVKSAEASIKLDEQREVYRPFASAGSRLFFLVKSLQAVCHVYQFSLSSFLALFKQSLASDDCKSAKTTEDRLELLVRDLQVRALYFVGQALFKTDRPMFALHIVKGMHPDQFQPKEWEIFTGSLVASVSDVVPRGYPSWAPSERQAAFRLLSENLPHLINSLELDNVSKWSRFAASMEAEKDLPLLRGVSPFQRVLVIQAFRPDRLQTALLNFCNESLRTESVSPPPLSLATLLVGSDASTPLLLISSPGADASKELQEYAGKTVGAGNYEELAMGGGQQETAIHMLRTAAKNGSWLCLKNLHLVIAWLPSLEKELSSLEPNKDFRLWLTSEAHNSFPSILLQQSLKATFESPPGIKKNLQRTFESWDDDVFDERNPVRNRLLFLLACFHAVMQERRTYIPQGWTKFYEFSYGDMRAGTFVMEAVTDPETRGKGDIDWEAIHGLMEDAIYGGRIDNAFDLRVLRSYLKVFFSQEIVSDSGAGQEVLVGTGLKMPRNADYRSFRSVIDKLAEVDAPFVFSLPDNIERSLQRVTSSAVIRQLRALSTLDAEASKFDRDKWRSQLGPVLELWQQLTSATPGLLNKRVKERDGGPVTGGGKDPVDDFVGMESDLAGDLCTNVDVALGSLKKVLFGSGLLTPVIQAAATALLSSEVPSDWTGRWEGGPEKPQAWLRELVRKRISLMKWRTQSSKGSLLSEPLVLGDLFNPATFVNALRQQTARKLNTAIDRVRMVTSWDKDPMRGPMRSCPLPCTLAGLLLQGASFAGGGLQESSPEAMEMTPTPHVTIGFVSDPKDDRDTDTIGVPVYLSPSREEFLMEVEMSASTSGSIGEGRWVLSGVALFLSEGD